MLFTILVIIIIILLLGSFFYRPLSGSYTYAPSGLFGLLLVVLLILFLLHVI